MLLSLNYFMGWWLWLGEGLLYYWLSTVSFLEPGSSCYASPSWHMWPPHFSPGSWNWQGWGQEPSVWDWDLLISPVLLSRWWLDRLLTLWLSFPHHKYQSLLFLLLYSGIKDKWQSEAQWLDRILGWHIQYDHRRGLPSLEGAVLRLRSADSNPENPSGRSSGKEVSDDRTARDRWVVRNPQVPRKRPRAHLSPKQSLLTHGPLFQALTAHPGSGPRM